ncbi:hypothetical protein K488DRAFT_30560, partial [Vararia minispora EC-137]
PTLSLKIDDLQHPASSLFLTHLFPPHALRTALTTALTHLYLTPRAAPTHVRSIALILRPMDGVAYTTGTHDAKQIHLSCAHVVGAHEAGRCKEECEGVLVHEVVHCFQHNAMGTAPAGLIEGIADYVRLRAGLAPPHWTPGRRADGWDAGYATTGLFLDWLERRYGGGTVAALNAALAEGGWDEGVVEGVTGRKVGRLWEIY